jgi:sodium/bile acid cotransporter 7
MCSTHKTLALGLPLFKIIFQGRADLAVLLTPLILQHPLQLILGSMLAPRLKAIVELEEQ